MKKIMMLVLLFVGIFFIAVLSGCGEITSLKYQGEYRSLYQVQEMLEDALEAENPDLDLSININREIED